MPSKRSLQRSYNNLVDNNDHNEAALLLVKAFGNEDEVNKILSIKHTQGRLGYMPDELIDERRKIINKYRKLLFS